MKFSAIIAILLAVSPMANFAEEDGWAHDMKPPPPDRLFKTPYDVLIYNNLDITSDDRSSVTITADGDGNATIDVTFRLSRKDNPAIALMQDQYALHSKGASGWVVKDLKSRWKCRDGDTQSWQWRRDACSAKTE